MQLLKTSLLHVAEVPRTHRHREGRLFEQLRLIERQTRRLSRLTLRRRPNRCQLMFPDLIMRLWLTFHGLLTSSSPKARAATKPSLLRMARRPSLITLHQVRVTCRLLRSHKFLLRKCRRSTSLRLLRPSTLLQSTQRPPLPLRTWHQHM